MKQDIINQIKEISDVYRNIIDIEMDNSYDIWLTFNSILTVSQIREIESLGYSITNIHFDTKIVKFSKRYDRSA